MYKELNRLATFSDWQGSDSISPLQLARNGFYYSRNSGETVCFSCDLRISRWSDEESPWEHHQHLSPNCPLVAGTETRNIPLTPSTSTWKPPQGVSDRVMNASPDSIHKVLRSAMNRANANGLFSRNSTYRIDRNSPDFVQLRHETVRLGTFDDWPSTAHASPWALAREGFFYTGVEDRVQCAFCRGCLKRWQPTDYPSQEHSKHFPACPFVRGQDVGNVPAEGNSAEGTTMTLLGGDQSLLTSSNGFTLQMSERNQMTRQDLVQAPQTLDQGNELIDLEARMNVPAVRAVLDMGFSRDLVKRTIENKLSATGTDFLNAESLLDAVFLAGDMPNFHNDGSASAAATAAAVSSAAATTTATLSSSPSISFTATSVASQSVLPSDTRAVNAISGLTSLLSTHSSRDSGIFSGSSSTASLPAICSEFQHLFAHSSSSLSSSVASASVQSEAHALAPAKPDAVSASATVTMATIPEAETSTKTKLKAKRKRNRKKTPSSTVSSNKDLKQDLMTNRNNDEDAEGNEAGKEEEKEAGSEMDTNPDDEAQKYLEENRQLREARTCKVCMDEEVNTVFLPCGHLVCCNKCSPQLRNCPICRTFIRGTVKTSLP